MRSMERGSSTKTHLKIRNRNKEKDDARYEKRVDSGIPLSES